MQFIKSYYKLIIALMGVFVVGLLIGYNINYNNKDVSNDNLAYVDTTENIEEVSTIYVDIKGEVKKPGVYEMQPNSIIYDVIKKSGGLKKSAYTKNINLSKVVTNEMVIYVYSKSEIKKLKSNNVSVNDVVNPECKTEVVEVNNCPDIINANTTTKTTTGNNNTSTKEENKSTLININTASKEELMNLSGIGESKADLIIQYRSSKKFEKTEDIMNIKGIGQSMYDKIKDYITV